MGEGERSTSAISIGCVDTSQLNSGLCSTVINLVVIGFVVMYLSVVLSQGARPLSTGPGLALPSINVLQNTPSLYINLYSNTNIEL